MGSPIFRIRLTVSPFISRIQYDTCVALRTRERFRPVGPYPTMITWSRNSTPSGRRSWKLRPGNRPLHPPQAAAPPRQRRAHLNHERGQEKADDRGREEILTDLWSDEPPLPSHAREDKGELSHLGERAPHQCSHAKGISERQNAPDGHDRLSDQDGRQRPGDRERVGQEGARVHQHPHRDEEEAAETIPQGHDIREGLMAILRFGDDHSREECPQGEGEADLRRGPGGPQADEDDRDDKDLRTPELHHFKEDPRDEETGEDKDQGNGEDDLAQHPEDDGQTRSLFAAQEWREEHQGNDTEILEEEDPDGKAALR